MSILRVNVSEDLDAYDTMLEAAQGVYSRGQHKIFPDSWYPKPTPGYVLAWRNSVAQGHGTWVLVDIQGRPIMATVRKTKAFIDLSREARVRRNLQLLVGQLDRLLQESSEPSVRQQRSQGLSRLDQGLGDLVRIVRGLSASGSASRRGRARHRGAAAQAAPSTNDEVR